MRGRRLLGVLALLLLAGGITALVLAGRARPASLATEPAEWSLEQLLAQGPGTNRHVRVQDFTVCSPEIEISQSTAGKWRTRQLAIIIEPPPPAGVGPALPQAVRAVILLSETENQQSSEERLANVKQVHRQVLQLEGFQGLIVEDALDESLTAKLRELAPNTDPGRVLVIRDSLPGDAAHFRTWLFAGLASLFLAVVLGVFLHRGTRHVKVEASSASLER